MNIEVGGRLVIVAEIGANHCGNLQRAFDLIDAAKDSGADLVKFQCYEASTITIACASPDFIIKDGPWKGRTLYELYKRAETPFAWFPMLAERAAKIGIPWFASVFDYSAVDLLETLDCPLYKIASFEIVDLPLIRYVANKGKPVIISTGMADFGEIDQAVIACGANGPVLLHCISGYPTPVAEANLGRIKRLKDVSLCGESKVGISDHTTGIEVPIAATALGAVMIEKHMRLKGYADTEDAAFSLTPKQFLGMVKAVDNTWKAMQPSKSESQDSSRQLRRSLYVVKDIQKGEPFTHDNIRSIRPGNGAHPRYLPDLLGKSAPQNLARGKPLLEETVVSPVAAQPPSTENQQDRRQVCTAQQVHLRLAPEQRQEQKPQLDS